MTAAPHDPRQPQLRAADPGASAWVSANAGSGKTRVLIERVARMLLAGVKPHRILCLTYTNAAAAEMQNRLFEMLGEWAMLDDRALAGKLANLAEDAPEPDAAALARARRLFAEALEAPGGLKIQTIHAFCGAILRRFPMEAGVSPRFEVLDERGRADLMQEARDAAIVRAAQGDDPALGRAFDLLTAHMAEESLQGLFAEAASRAALFADPGSAEAALKALGAAPGADWRAEVLRWRDGLDPNLPRAAGILSTSGRNNGWVGIPLGEALATNDPGVMVERASSAFFDSKLIPRDMEKTPTGATHTAEPWIRPLLHEAQQGFLDLRDRVNALRRGQITEALHVMAGAVLRNFATLKARRGVLDFDDIIARTLALLERRETAAWVLYKLDGGLDHILVDEAQDTSPDQWRVISALAEEFHAGRGAREARRTLFVVGDEKQSIYSFQGADPREFERMRAALADRLEAMGEELRSPALITSFRSATAILAAVDNMLADPAAKGMSAAPPAKHNANLPPEEHPGRVDLWPVLTPGEKPEERPWWEPVDAPSPADPELLLAGAIAQEVARMLAEGDVIPGKGRPVAPGDILILVRRRGKLAKEILRRLREYGVPVGGADRLKVAEHLAVKDLLALAKAALLPEDDLSVAALLRSPLCDVPEEALFGLAHDRGATRLWDRALTAADAHPIAAVLLRDMADQADYRRPFEFLQRALIRHDGRRRLIGRLGPEAEDAIDELLSLALAYEQTETPSLQGFVDWVETGDPEIKREQQPRDKEDPGVVRLMTVHGAKGLEAPVVILPDTLAPAKTRPSQILTLEGPSGPVAISGGRAQDDPPAAAAARAEAERRANEERLRLLYVAMTRAEDWLIVCAAGKEDRAEAGWHGLVRRAIADKAKALRTPLSEQGYGDGLRLEDPFAADATTRTAEPPSTQAAAEPPPAWLTAPLPPEPAAPKPLSPSDLGGAHALPAEEADDDSPDARARALRRGDLIHRALELAADAPHADRAALIDHVTAGGADLFDAAERAAMATEALRVLEAPEFADIFAPDALAEPALWAEPPELGGRRIMARLDRLIVRRDEAGAVTARIIDFKTNRATPDRPEDTPEAFLRQLGAYRAAIAALYPDAKIETAILWTCEPRLTEIPAELTVAALSRAFADLAS